ncbi:hypothetical protein PMAYCL1PPCAC_27316 [Pristionchus mayeri]|uniref:Uncharacterized protein n=1 Tax=Pristionchus mayeri TaxID=1317129 RepID=A0AAN5IBX7_9BILA|nr:hypothetical protein PMAYCL1PPCAC_27316 [Pristionchus mayeri]
MSLRRALHIITYVLALFFVGLIFVYARLILVLLRKNKRVPTLLKIMLLNIVVSHLMEVFSGIIFCWFDYNIFSGFSPIVIYKTDEDYEMYLSVNLHAANLTFRATNFRLRSIAAF